MKAINIRDYKNKPQHRKMIGLFKALAYAKDLTQAEMLDLVMKNYYQNHKYEVKEQLRKIPKVIRMELE
jgi:hypothetical protein